MITHALFFDLDGTLTGPREGIVRAKVRLHQYPDDAVTLNVMRKDPRKASLRSKLNLVAWNNLHLASLIAQL